MRSQLHIIFITVNSSLYLGLPIFLLCVIAPYNQAIDLPPIVKRQFTQCTSYHGDYGGTPDLLKYRVICATRMYRGLIVYDMDVYGTSLSRD